VRRIETVMLGPWVSLFGSGVGTASMPRRLARSNSLSWRSALITDETRAGFAPGRDPRKVFGDGWSPLGEPGSGERSPTRFERAVEHVTVAEVLNRKPSGSRQCRNLAALNVAADSHEQVITALGEVAAAVAIAVEVADLVGRMDVRLTGQGPIARVWCRPGPVRDRTDEAHHRPGSRRPG